MSMKKIILAVIAVMLTASIAYGGGIARNNPGNIVKTGALWEGQVPTKGRFVKFESAHHGLRAIAVVLIRYQQWHQIKTVEKLTARWAPEFENNTSEYENFIARALGVYTKSPIWITHHLPDIVKAIVHFENGENPYSDDEIIAACEDALDHCGITGYWRINFN